ncbi:MAG: type I-U CRISPR-associated protein Cas5/Cas6 [Opitutaceae bacterium]|nr:type I-U CRISPR-associated protein Cas5/Cas6 [Opitutaceae bacterium]
MTTIQLTFPWGRFYATPWGINASRLREPEWPPSPWRLLRALVSAWFRAHAGQEPSSDYIALIETLARELPLISTGKVSFGQTVHWQPNYGGAGTEDKAEAVYKNTRHENHFAAVPGPLYFRWQGVSLSPSQESLLKSLLAEITYFGRAESICNAELCDTEQPTTEICWCVPTNGRKISSTCRDVFCPKPDDFEFADLWSKRGDPSRSDMKNAPPHLGDRLLSTNMQADGGAWRSYQMPDGWPHKFIVRTPRSPNVKITSEPCDGPKVAHYLRFSLQCRVPIASKFTVPLAEMFRDSANYHLCKVHGDRARSPALLGIGATKGHQHAFYLPMAHDKTLPRMLTDLHIWCPMGLTRAEVDVLLRIRRLSWGNGHYPVNPVLVAMGHEPPEDVRFGRGTSGKNPPTSRIWQSATPFVPPGHFFTGGKTNPRLKVNALPETQLCKALRDAGVLQPATIQRLSAFQHPSVPHHPVETAPPLPDWDIVRAPDGMESDKVPLSDAIEAIAHRNGSNSDRVPNHRRIGFFFQITFDERTALPMPSFGCSSHFGLGLFLPVD